MKAFSKFSLAEKTSSIFPGQDSLKNHILNKADILYVDDPTDYSILQNNNEITTDYVWLVRKGIEIYPSFPWYYNPTQLAVFKFPYVFEESRKIKSYDEVRLVPRNAHNNNFLEIEEKYICGHYSPYKGQDKFDIFYIGKDTEQFEKIKKNHNIQIVDSFQQAQEQSFTDMFWAVYDDTLLRDTFKFSYKPDEWSFDFVHVFGNGDIDRLDGVALFPKNLDITDKELEHRFYANKKEIRIMASTPREYEKYSFKNYEEYLHAQEYAKTELFWYVPDDIIVKDNFDFSMTFSHHNIFDRTINHVWLNGETYDGIILLSKHAPISEKEFEHRFIANKKEWNVEASKPKPYPVFMIDNWEEYEYALENSETDLFWANSRNIDTINWNFNIYYSHHNRFDREINHVFGHSVGDEILYNGLFLCSKLVPLTPKEIEYRYIVNKKEHKEIASKAKQYQVFFVDSWDEYQYALENSETEMFWADSRNIDTSGWKFDLYFSHDNKYDREINHVFGHKVGDEILYNGLFLCSKASPLTQKEVEHRYIVNKKQHEDIASNQLKYQVFEISCYDDYLNALSNSETEMFWGLPNDVQLEKGFDFDLYFSHDNKFDREINHIFLNGEHRDGVVLFSKHSPFTQKEIDHRFYSANKKEWDIVASNPKRYDHYYINTYDEYLDAVEKSFSEMFWVIPNDIELLQKDILDFYLPHSSTDRKTNHVWKNGANYDGIALMSKHSVVTEKEFTHRFLVDRIEHNEVVSIPKRFEKFIINGYEDYSNALLYSKTDMFWGIPEDVEPDDTIDWDKYVSELETLDRSVTHVFKNGDDYDGVALYSKSNSVSEKEIEHRFYADKKEHDVMFSKPKKYNVFTINNYDDYTNALYHTATEMFWGVPSDIVIREDFDLDLYFSHHNTFDRNINHVFLNGENYDGLVLFSKNVLVSEKEIEHRFIIQKKEWDIVASDPKPFPIYTINDYTDYMQAKEECNTGMFWITYNDILPNKDFNWNFYISHHNQYERKINHVWKNNEYYDGIALVSKDLNLSQREIDYRFFAVKKEYDEVASQPKPYDIVFISNGEPNADDNFNLLSSKFARAKHVQNIKGIHQAHKRAAELVETDMFWVVDADAEILEEFNFDYYVPKYDIDGQDTVHVWRSYNPVNGLVYGYGGVKLLPTHLTRNVDVNSADMTTSISDKFKAIAEMSNKTLFNTDAFSAWRSGFRECAKLSSKTIARQVDEETEFRLDAWCTRGDDKPFGKFAIAGAKAGKQFGEENKSNVEEMKKINDFEWLKAQFNQLILPDE